MSDILDRLYSGNPGVDSTYPKIMAEAADEITRLRAEVARLTEEKAGAISTLNAWFDRRKLGHDAVDATIIDAAKGYLRTSRIGGMPRKSSDMVETVIADMARLGVFADIYARTMSATGFTEACAAITNGENNVRT